MYGIATLPKTLLEQLPAPALHIIRAPA